MTIHGFFIFLKSPVFVLMHPIIVNKNCAPICALLKLGSMRKEILLAF